MKKTKKNSSETFESKLRNLLTPAFNLPYIIRKIEDDPRMMDHAITEAETVISQQPKILELLKEMEASRKLTNRKCIHCNDEFPTTVVMQHQSTCKKKKDKAEEKKNRCVECGCEIAIGNTICGECACEDDCYL